MIATTAVVIILEGFVLSSQPSVTNQLHPLALALPEPEGEVPGGRLDLLPNGPLMMQVGRRKVIKWAPKRRGGLS